MATHKGSEGTVKSGANAIAEIRSYTITETADTLEDTSMGDSSRTYLASLKTFSGSIECFWDETDTNGQLTLDPGATVTINVYPEGSTSGDTYYTGSVIITEKSITASFDGMVEASFSFQGTGALSETTV
jgi:predicted secreted protein